MVSFALIVFLSLFFEFAFLGAQSRITNETIDDADVGPFDLGDSKLARISFYPPVNGFWDNQNGNQLSVVASPQSVKAFQNTFTTATVHSGPAARSIVIDFFGTSITAYFTLADAFPTECDVTLDGKQEFPLRSAANSRSEEYSYKVPAISYTELPPGLHRLEIKVTPFSAERINYVNFDYAEYTYDTDDADKFLAAASGLNLSLPPPTESKVDTEEQKAKSGAQLAGLIVGIIGGSIVIAATILIVYFRSRSRKTVSSVQSKVDISQLEKGSDGDSKRPSVFRRTLRSTFERVRSWNRHTATNQAGVPVSFEGHNDRSLRYSITSSINSDVSSKAQPMYQDFGNAEKWEDLTSLASQTPKRHQIQSFGVSTKVANSPPEPEAAEGGRRLKYPDSRLDSLGLHLYNIQSARTALGDLGSRASQASAPPPNQQQQQNERDLTATYQYSLPRQPSAPSVRSLEPRNGM